MDKFLLQVCCLALLQVVLVRGYCDSNNLNSAVQKCLFMSPVFSQGGLSNVNKVETFCRKSLNSVVSCMDAPIQECRNHPTQKRLLDLLIDMNKLRSGLQYLCDHVQVFSEKSSCMDSVVMTASPCMENAVGDLTNRMQTVQKFKDVFDQLCTFFDRLINCYVDPFTGECQEIGTIFKNVFNGVRYPYCDLQEHEKQARMAEIEMGMGPTQASSRLDQSVCTIILSLLVIFYYY